MFHFTPIVEGHCPSGADMCDKVNGLQKVRDQRAMLVGERTLSNIDLENSAETMWNSDSLDFAWIIIVLASPTRSQETTRLMSFAYAYPSTARSVQLFNSSP
jgi:hypothetical protein